MHGRPASSIPRESINRQRNNDTPTPQYTGLNDAHSTLALRERRRTHRAHDASFGLRRRQPSPPALTMASATRSGREYRQHPSTLLQPL